MASIVKSGNDQAFERRENDYFIRKKVRGQRFKKENKKKCRKLRNGKEELWESIRCREAVPARGSRGEEFWNKDSYSCRTVTGAQDSKSKALRGENDTHRDLTLPHVMRPTLVLTLPFRISLQTLP